MGQENYNLENNVCCLNHTTEAIHDDHLATSGQIVSVACSTAIITTNVTSATDTPKRTNEGIIRNWDPVRKHM